MKPDRLLPIVGFVLLTLGVTPLLARTVQQVPATPPDVTEMAEASPSEVVVETVELLAPAVEGLDDSIVRVLHSQGFLGTADPVALSGELPASVVSVLVERGVVLPVAGSGGGP